MKASVFYQQVDNLESDALARMGQAERLVVWAREVLGNARLLREEADAHGLPSDAADRLATFRRVLEEGPPDGSPPEGGTAPEVQTGTVGRLPCAECGSRGKHKKTCSKSSNNAGRREETGEPAKCEACGWVGKTALPLESMPPKGTCPKCGSTAVGTSYRQAVARAEETKYESDKAALSRAVMAHVGAGGPYPLRSLEVTFPEAYLRNAIQLAVLETWGDPVNPTIGTAEQLRATVRKIAIKSGDRIGETAAALNISAQKATEVWAAILKEQAP